MNNKITNLKIETLRFVRSVHACCSTALQNHQGTIMFLLGAALISFGVSELALAQEGAEIFQQASSNLACQVMPGKFGAMVSAFAGMFAIVSAATGSYRGAWMLLFVSIGAFIFKELIQILFPNSANC